MKKRNVYIIFVFFFIISGIYLYNSSEVSLKSSVVQSSLSNLNLSNIADVGVVYSESEIHKIITEVCSAEFDPENDFDDYDALYDGSSASYWINDEYSIMYVIKYSETEYEIVSIFLVYPEELPIVKNKTIFDEYIGKNVEDLFNALLIDSNIKKHGKLMLTDGYVTFIPFVGTHTSFLSASDVISGKYLEQKITGFGIAKIPNYD